MLPVHDAQACPRNGLFRNLCEGIRVGQSAAFTHGRIGMLVLGRHLTEEIWIGGDDSVWPEIRIHVVDIRSDKIRLGIEAAGKKIHRKEIWLDIMSGIPPTGKGEE